MQTLSDLLLCATFGPVDMNARLRSNSSSRCNGIAPAPFYLQYLLPLPLLPSTYISGNHCSLIRLWKIPFLACEACSSHSLGRPFNPAENAFVFLSHLFLKRKTGGVCPLSWAAVACTIAKCMMRVWYLDLCALSFKFNHSGSKKGGDGHP